MENVSQCNLCVYIKLLHFFIEFIRKVKESLPLKMVKRLFLSEHIY